MSSRSPAAQVGRGRKGIPPRRGEPPNKRMELTSGAWRVGAPLAAHPEWFDGQ